MKEKEPNFICVCVTYQVSISVDIYGQFHSSYPSESAQHERVKRA